MRLKTKDLEHNGSDYRITQVTPSVAEFYFLKIAGKFIGGFEDGGINPTKILQSFTDSLTKVEYNELRNDFLRTILKKYDSGYSPLVDEDGNVVADLGPLDGIFLVYKAFEFSMQDFLSPALLAKLGAQEGSSLASTQTGSAN